jgi:hypothetical protein
MPNGHNWQGSFSVGPAVTLAPEDVTSVQARLHELHESMSAGERVVLEALLSQAAADGGTARADQPGQEKSTIIFVGGRQGVPIRIGLGSAAPVSLNPQPIPPGRAASRSS